MLLQGLHQLCCFCRGWVHLHAACMLPVLLCSCNRGCCSSGLRGVWLCTCVAVLPPAAAMVLQLCRLLLLQDRLVGGTRACWLCKQLLVLLQGSCCTYRSQRRQLCLQLCVAVLQALYVADHTLQEGCCVLACIMGH